MAISRTQGVSMDWSPEFSFLIAGMPVAVLARAMDRNITWRSLHGRLRNFSLRLGEEMAKPTTPQTSRCFFVLMRCLVSLICFDLACYFWLSVLAASPIFFDIMLFNPGWRGRLLGVFGIMAVALAYSILFSVASWVNSNDLTSKGK